MRYINTGLLSLGAVFAVGFWTQWRAGTDETRKALDVWQRESRTSMDNLKDSLGSLKTDGAVLTALRFTSGDWVRAKEVLDTKFNDQDRRIGKIEEAIPIIKDSLKRMEQALGSNPSGK